MSYPSPEIWKVTGGPSIFIIPDGLIMELEHLKQKTKKNDPNPNETSEKAIEAIKNIRDLFCRGKISEGIAIPGGWAISVASPNQDGLKTAFSQIEDIVNSFHPSDVKYLLLTRECVEKLPTPVIMVTGEINLFNIAQANGVPLHLMDGFPLETPNEVNEAIKLWNRGLRKMQVSAKRDSVVVDATLTNYNLAPEWLGAKSLIVAEGNGVLHDGKKIRPFRWTVPFYPRYIITDHEPSHKDAPELPSIHMDFFGEPIDQSLFDGIADRLSDCATIHFEEGKPTLQNPESIMEILLYFEYLLRNPTPENALEELKQDIEKSEGMVHCWTDWILALEDEDERTATLEGFIEAISGCWKIGHTYKFSFVPNT
jgi:hypothetical protein